jgi:hypothetical protein
MKRVIKAPLAALAALWAGALLAQGAPAAPSAAQMDRLAILLDLTDAQKTQVQPILAAGHAQIRQLVEQIKASGTKPDFESLRAARQQIRQDTLTKLSGVLSPTQLKKFEALQQMAHEHHRGFGRGGAASTPGNAPPQN